MKNSENKPFTRSKFIKAMLSIAVVFGAFITNAFEDRHTVASFVGDAIGTGVIIIVLGLVIGTIFWLPFVAVKGVRGAPDFKTFVFVGTIITAFYLSLPGQYYSKNKDPRPKVEDKAEWIKDLKTGCAVWVWSKNPKPSAISWSGECIDGKAVGKGILQWYQEGKPGSRYEGEYKDGKEHGRGVFTWASGSCYEGEFKDGKKHGHGVFTLPNGLRYEGEYKNDWRHGHVVITEPDGTSVQAVFNYGERVK